MHACINARERKKDQIPGCVPVPCTCEHTLCVSARVRKVSSPSRSGMIEWYSVHACACVFVFSPEYICMTSIYVVLVRRLHYTRVRTCRSSIIQRLAPN